ncbi:MAG: glycoside hydrolase family 2 TIM barrel-domain containing protein, partial [Bacteroidota bacterium]
YVNGVKVKFRGVNRHCFWPETGRTTSPAVDRMDIAAIKGMNMNAVRMSHYAPDESFLRLADSAGLYIIDELAGWQQAYSTKIGTPLVRELVERDVNRPSVVLWANGNEGGSNHELLPLYAKYDPQQRTVIHPWGMVNDTDTKHYKPFDCCAGSQFHGETVFFPTEFLHGLYDGGHGASLNEYWEAMYQHPLSAGGFLWNLADEGVVRTDRNGVLDTYGNYGADGILGPHREKEGSYYTIREIWSPLQLKTKRLPTHWDGRLQLENRFHRTNLADCTLTAVLVRYPSSTDVLGNDLLALPTTPLPNLLPGTMGFHQLALPENYAAYHALEVAAFRPNGQLLHGWTLPIQRPAAVAEALLSGLTKLGTVRVDTQGAAITLTVADHQLSIVKASGQLQQFSRPGNTAPITAGPVIATDTIGRHAMGYTLSALPDGGQRVSFTFADGFRKLNWALHPNGIAELDYAFAPKEGGKYIRMQLDYIGLNFTLPETEIAGISYLGGGPHRVYKNRMRGPRMGQYYKAYNDAMTGAAWEYPEFKGYYRDLYWARFHGREGAGDFSLISASENVFLRLYTPRLPDDARPGVSPPYPAGDVSLMHAIPPIGTKFKLPDQLGPAGAPQFYSPSPTDDLFYRGRFYLQLEE